MFFSQFNWNYWVWRRKTTAGKCHSHDSSGQNASTWHCCWCYLLAKEEAVVLLFSFSSFPFPSISVCLPPLISVSLTFSSTSLLPAPAMESAFLQEALAPYIGESCQRPRLVPRCAQCSCEPLLLGPGSWQHKELPVCIVANLYTQIYQYSHTYPSESLLSWTSVHMKGSNLVPRGQWSSYLSVISHCNSEKRDSYLPDWTHNMTDTMMLNYRCVGIEKSHLK